MTTAPWRLVLDTQVALDLLHFADPRTVALRAALEAGEATLVSDVHCRAEWCRVLAYPVLRLDAAAQRALTSRYDELAPVLDEPAPRAVPVPPLPRCADRDDQKFLELAFAADATALLSRDVAVLALARRCERQGRFAILAPEAFDRLRAMRADFVAHDPPSG
jgi:predicted nucleic acid-binding protein